MLRIVFLALVATVYVSGFVPGGFIPQNPREAKYHANLDLTLRTVGDLNRYQNIIYSVSTKERFGLMAYFMQLKLQNGTDCRVSWDVTGRLQQISYYKSDCRRLIGGETPINPDNRRLTGALKKLLRGRVCHQQVKIVLSHAKSPSIRGSPYISIFKNTRNQNYRVIWTRNVVESCRRFKRQSPIRQ